MPVCLLVGLSVYLSVHTYIRSSIHQISAHARVNSSDVRLRREDEMRALDVLYLPVRVRQLEMKQKPARNHTHPGQPKTLYKMLFWLKQGQHQMDWHKRTSPGAF